MGHLGIYGDTRVNICDQEDGNIRFVETARVHAIHDVPHKRSSDKSVVVIRDMT